jgi:hypothetical protein
MMPFAKAIEGSHPASAAPQKSNVRDHPVGKLVLSHASGEESRALRSREPKPT